jgi:hypothetical protein
MKKFARVFLMCVVSLTLTACIQVDTVVNVKTDGSGTIEETFLMRKDLLQQMKKMMEEMAKSMAEMMTEGENSGKIQKNADSEMKAEAFDIFDEAKLRESARHKGEGVTFIGGSKIITDDYEGYKAMYAFEDINKVKINQNPGEKVPSVPQQGGSDTDRNEKEYVIFTFHKGNPAELIIKSPRSSMNSKSESSENTQPSQNNDKPSEEMTDQVKQLFQGMKITLTVAVDGNIVETNASHREGSKITLAELDFGKVMEMPELFTKLSPALPKSMEESKLLMQDIPGIKVDLHDEIRIRFE